MGIRFLITWFSFYSFQMGKERKLDWSYGVIQEMT